MAFISIFSGSFCNANAVADGVARQMGYERVDEKLLELASKRFGVSEERLARALEGSPPFLNRFTHSWEKSLVHLRAVLAELVKDDNAVYHGSAGHLVPQGIWHVLRVCVIANLDHRVAVAVERDGCSEEDAIKRIRDYDERHGRWTRHLHNQDPYHESMYDMVIAMQDITVDDAVARICQAAENEEVRTSAESLSAADDFILSSQVELALVPRGYDIEVRCSHGDVTIAVHQYVSRLEPLARQLSAIARQVPGVRSAHCVPGNRFVPPSLLVPSKDLEPPPKKILLVDDEREFVHTLSERLQARDLESAVVYDGEQALSFVATDEPEVMVLDLKMPGIDGIEVLRRIKQDHPRVEVIILTGHGSKREEELASELGAFAYLRKPVDIELLTKTMKEAYRKVASSGGNESSDSEE